MWVSVIMEIVTLSNIPPRVTVEYIREQLALGSDEILDVTQSIEGSYHVHFRGEPTQEQIDKLAGLFPAYTVKGSTPLGKRIEALETKASK